MQEATKTTLTEAQKNCLDKIKAFVTEKGYGPSVRELTALVGLKSTSGTIRLLYGLEQRGHIKRLPGAKRAITIL